MKHSFAVHRVEGATKPMDLMSYVIRHTGTNYYRCVVCQIQKRLLSHLVEHVDTHITKKSTGMLYAMQISYSIIDSHVWHGAMGVCCNFMNKLMLPLCKHTRMGV